MKPQPLLLLVLSMACGRAGAADGFGGLSCGADIAKALTGRHMSNEPVVAIEARHKDLGLKDLGADELDWGSEVWWRICDARYAMLLDRHDVVRDVLKFSDQPRTTVVEGACKG